jgi:hypothetical protein
MLSETLAAAPFDDARADLILQSSDEKHFRVFKLILSLASPIFTDMFRMPSPPSQNSHEVQVVSLSEDSTALDVALRHIYPMQTPDGDTLLYASILAEFARKYEVDGLNKYISRYLTDSIELDPVGVYAVSIAYGYNSIGANAARSCLNLPFSDLQSPYLRCITTELELLKYHAACGVAASVFASSNRTWPTSLIKTGIFTPQCGGGTACQRCSMSDFIDQTYIEDASKTDPSRIIKSAPRCVWNYLHRSALLLARHPGVEAITAEGFVLKSNDCNSCKQYMRGQLLEFSEVLGKEIKMVLERVSLIYHCTHCPCLR